MMMITSVFAAAIALVSAGPTGGQSADPANSTIAAPAPAGSDAAHRDTRRYCIQDTITGSRLPRQSCKTREQWLAEGFDPLKK